MKTIKIGAATVNQTPMDWDNNYNNIINVIDDAIKQNVDLLLLPELCVSGYGCEDTFFMPHVLDFSFEIIIKIRDYLINKNICVAIGSPFAFNGSIYNCCFIIGHIQSKINTTQCILCIPKQNLCADGVHYETRWFKAWERNRLEVSTYNINNVINTVSITDGIFSLKDCIIGVEICEDAWVHNRPGIDLASKGVEVILNPSASHFSFGKNKTREALVEQSSRAFNCVYVYANLLGNESGRVIYDGDTYIASQGKIVSSGERLTFDKYILTTAVVDLDKNNVKKYQSHGNNKLNDYQNGFDIRNIKLKRFNYELESGNINNPFKKIRYGTNLTLQDDYSSFTKAVSLGLWDYMRKTKSKGFVVSLSGGADSATVACLVRSMVISAYNECLESMIEYLESFDVKVILTQSHDENIRFFCKHFLTCVYQATDYSSDETELAASYLANSIGASFYTIDVQPIVNEYKKLTESMIERDLSWEIDDIALQNIQARVRAPSVWMITNILGALLLSTSNRSEAAVGYATMDGDTCGGLSPIAGVSKQFILEWLKDYAATELANFNGLSHILRQKPTAELRPEEQNQNDEDDLMPYPVLNEIEVMAVKYKMSPKEIEFVLTKKNIPNASLYVIKFFKLFSKNQWKRERYAPSFHLDDESLDPKTFYRFPILNSGFKKEIDDILINQMEMVLK